MACNWLKLQGLKIIVIFFPNKGNFEILLAALFFFLKSIYFIKLSVNRVYIWNIGGENVHLRKCDKFRLGEISS